MYYKFLFSLALILFALRLHLAVATVLREDIPAYCFQFTWLGPSKDGKGVNCTKLKDSPCFKPFVVSETPPNTTNMWQYERDKYTCLLSPGFGCIKHVFIYNNAVVNSTHFCGKMIEDKTSAVTSKCFIQEVDGHTIESCTCQSDSGARPCNFAKNNQYSFMFLCITLLIHIIYL